VSALAFTRFTPFNSNGARGGRTLVEFGGPNPVERVDWCGTGCLLIRREALLRVPRPFFDHAPGEPGTAEDVFFTQRANKAGVPVHIDTGICVGHLSVTSVDLEHVMAWEATASARREVQQAGQL
jgi:GT2 family glycosyltransferase